MHRSPESQSHAAVSAHRRYWRLGPSLRYAEGYWFAPRAHRGRVESMWLNEHVVTS
jgi:hypothetical protein